jgi:hypothetical protein
MDSVVDTSLAQKAVAEMHVCIGPTEKQVSELFDGAPNGYLNCPKQICWIAQLHRSAMLLYLCKPVDEGPERAHHVPKAESLNALANTQMCRTRSPA